FVLFVIFPDVQFVLLEDVPPESLRTADIGVAYRAVFGCRDIPAFLSIDPLLCHISHAPPLPSPKAGPPLGSSCLPTVPTWAPRTTPRQARAGSRTFSYPPTSTGSTAAALGSRGARGELGSEPG